MTEDRREEKTSEDPLSLRAFLWLGTSALGLRLAYLSEHAASAFMNVPVLDEKYYDTVGRLLAEGRSIAEVNPGFRPLLYPFFLALWHRLGGDWGRLFAVVAQHLLGVVTVLLVVALAARLFRRKSAGVVAGTLYLLAGPPLFFEGELLITTLFTFLVTSLLWALSGLEDDRRRGWLLAGLVTAVAAQARPNVLLFLPALPLVALWPRRLGWKDRTTLAGLALAGAFLGLAAFGAVNARYTGHFEWLGGSGGVNLYLGNKQGADGRIPRQDRPVTYGEEYRDSVQVFAEEVYREATGDVDPDPGSVSRYWLGRTWEEVRAAPSDWVLLMGRKVSYLAANREIPNNKSWDFVTEHESALLRFLPVRWWLLFALAPLGAWAAWRDGERRILLWLGLFVVLYSGSVVLFFVNSRYRIPLWPAMAVLGAGGVLTLFEAVRAKRFGELGKGAAVFAAAAAVSIVSAQAVEPESFARDFFFRSLAQLEKGRLAEALADARRSVELDADDAAAHFQLATAALAAERYSVALEGFRRAAELKPGEPRIWNNLGVAWEELGRPGEAYRCYLRAIELVETYPPPLVNAALLELRAGKLDEAEERVRRAAGLGFESVSFYFALAAVERERGRREASERALAEAVRRDAAAFGRLVEESREWLAPSALEIKP